jgi:hypothetical protein
MTPQEEEDAKVRRDLQALAKHVDHQLGEHIADPSSEDEEIGRLRQRVAELEGMLKQALDLLQALCSEEK